MRAFMSWLYLALAAAGGYFPLAAAYPWFAANGFDLTKLLAEATATQAAVFFSQDLMWVAIASLVFIVYEGSKLALGWRWALIIPALCCAVSFGLPLFLFFRERFLARQL